MRKKYMILGGLLVLVGCFSLAGCNKKAGLDDKTRKIQKENRDLRKQLERLILEKQEAQERETVASQEENEEDEETDKETIQADEELKQVITAYIEAQYNYTDSAKRIENMRPYMTEEYASIYDDMGTSNSSYMDEVQTRSKITKFEIYKTECTGRKGTAVVRVDSYFQIDKDKVENKSLLELQLKQDDTGGYLIDSQTIYNISQ